MISQYIQKNNTYRYLYRSDARPPIEILIKGFTGSKIFWFNNIFGTNTVFTTDIIEATYEAFKKNNGKNVFYLYEIDAIGLEIFSLSDVASQNNKQNLANILMQAIQAKYKQAKQKDMSVDQSIITFKHIKIWIDMAIKYKNHWKEIVVKGPIDPWRIKFKKLIFPDNAEIYIKFDPLLTQYYLNK